MAHKAPFNIGDRVRIVDPSFTWVGLTFSGRIGYVITPPDSDGFGCVVRVPGVGNIGKTFHVDHLQHARKA